MLNLSDFNVHGHQGKHLKAYEAHKRSRPQGKKKKTYKITPDILSKKKPENLVEKRLCCIFAGNDPP